MSLTKTLSIPALVAALMVSAAVVSTARADDDEGHFRGSHQMAQAGTPGSGPMIQGERSPGRGAAAGTSRRESRMKRMAESRIQLLDSNGDGKISAAEIVAEKKRLFAAADVNGDGKLSADEFRRRGRWFVQLGTMSFFDMLDADGDGQLSATELTGPSERWFKRYDADKNGTIDAEEYVKARGRAAHGGRR